MKRSISWLAGWVVLVSLSGSALARDPASWIGTWQNSPIGLPTAARVGPFPLLAAATVTGTIRYRLRISQGGSRIRLQLSNEYGERPLAVRAVSVGLAGTAFDALPGSIEQARFSGKSAITIPAGTAVLTDPIDLPVQSGSDLHISVYVPEGAPIFAWSAAAAATDPIVLADVDATLVEHLPKGRHIATTQSIVTAVHVLAARPRKVVVTLGDSITDGGIDQATGERGWPGALARRLQTTGIAVVNAGISGNRLLQSTSVFGKAALARLDQDVLSVPGLTHVVVLEGINDIGMSGEAGPFDTAPQVMPEDLIAAYRQIIARAHLRGAKVIGATLLPFAGAIYYSEEKERIRQTVNQWIRSSRAFDGIIDFDAAMRDPAQPNQLRAVYDPGDHLHPNPAGYRQMGRIIDLSLFD